VGSLQVLQTLQRSQDLINICLSVCLSIRTTSNVIKAHFQVVICRSGAWSVNNHLRYFLK
jgi:hypothetical protein